MTVISAGAVLLAAGHAASDRVEVKLDVPVKIGLKSEPVPYKGTKLTVFSAGQATFFSLPQCGKSERNLFVTLKAAVEQYNKTEYRISAAVYDKAGKLIGSASAVEKVEYIRLGVMPTLFRDITFDFGANKDWGRAAWAEFSVNSPNVPLPPDAK